MKVDATTLRKPIHSLRRRFAECAYGHRFRLLSLTCFSWLGIALTAQTQAPHQLQGTVVFSDGKPAAGATVRAKSTCHDRSGDVQISYSQDSTTSEDGSFSFPVFDRDCNRYSFSASKPTDFWLPSNQNVFTGASPSVPTTEWSPTGPSQSVQIVLKHRGGKVEIQVWDVATNRFIFAHIDIRRTDKAFGSVSTATGADGSAVTEFLPGGSYSAEIMSYPCADEQYRTEVGPVGSFVAKPGTLSKQTIRVDVRTITPLPRYDGHKLANCGIGKG